MHSGAEFVTLKCQEPDDSIAFYGISNNVESRAFGKSTVKKVYGRYICKLGGFTANNVIDFSCGKCATVFVMKGEDKPPPSIIPDKPDEKGLIHFYKQDNEWKFLTSAEYEEHKGELPPLSFATRHPIG